MKDSMRTELSLLVACFFAYTVAYGEAIREKNS